MLSNLVQNKEKEKKHPFDRAHGVDTDGLIYAHPAASDADHDHASARHNAGYYATAPSLFRGAIQLWRETLEGTGYALEDYTLVDIGCGKGRVLMLSTEYAFREIVGVELNPALARIARRNLRKWPGVPQVSSLRPGRAQSSRVPQVRGPHERVFVRGVEIRGPREQVFVRGVESRVPQVSSLRPGRTQARIQILEADALSVPLPDTPVALFYFNSFEREMTEMWLARLCEIARDRTHPLDLIYIHPEFDALVRQVPGMRALADAEIPFTEEDAAADVFGVDNDRCVIYRLLNSA